MLEEYYGYKLKYKDYIVMIKSGNFYEILDKDAVIINKLLGYKLSKISDTIKCGFPITSLTKVLDILNKNNINYVVDENGCIIIQKEFEINKYNNFEYDINNIKYNFIKINKITKYLNDNAYKDIAKLLDEIERLVITYGIR